MEELLSDFLSKFVSTLAGAFVAAAFAYLLYRRGNRESTTRSLINEFFSADFLRHRIAFASLRRKVLTGKVAINDVAKGYWYPGGEEAYEGELFGDLE